MTDWYQKNYDKYDWILFYEIDEFLNLHNYTNVKQFLNEKKFKKCQLIYLNLLLILITIIYITKISLYLKDPEIVPISKAYFEVKSILRGYIPNTTINCLHTINKEYTNCNGYGYQNKINNIWATEPDYTYYYIDHYYCKSTEEFIEKINRGDCLYNTDYNYKMQRIEKLSKQNIFKKEKLEMTENRTGLSLKNINKLCNNIY